MTKNVIAALSKAIFVAVSIATTLAFGAAPHNQPRWQNSSDTMSRQKQPFTDRQIPSFEDLVELVRAVKEKTLPETRLIQRVQKGGFGFLTLTSDQRSQLEAAGASSRVMDAIDGRLKVYEPPPPPPKAPAKITIFCEPVDCTVSINNEEVGKTEHGVSAPQVLKEGAYAIRASVPGYQTEQPERPLAVKDGVNQELRFRFSPSKETLEKAAKSLYQNVIDNLGGQDLLKAASSFRAAGTITLFDRSGKESAWALETAYKSPDSAKFVVTRGSQNYTAIHTARGYEWDKVPDQAPDLEDVLMRACRFQIAVLLRQFESPQYELMTSRIRPIQGSDNILEAQGSPDAYVMDIDPYMHVKEMKIQSSSLNNGMRAIYGDYTGAPNRMFAKVTQILLPDAPRHGVEVRYADVTYSPADLTDADFTFKAHKAKRANRGLFMH